MGLVMSDGSAPGGPARRAGFLVLSYLLNKKTRFGEPGHQGPVFGAVRHGLGALCRSAVAHLDSVASGVELNGTHVGLHEHHASPGGFGEVFEQGWVWEIIG